MGSYLLVAHVDDANTPIDTTVIYIDDVPTAESEYRINPLVLECPSHKVATRDDTSVAALPYERVFRRRGSNFFCRNACHQMLR